MLHIVVQGIGNGHLPGGCGFGSLRYRLLHAVMGKALRISKTQHTLPIGILEVIGKAKELHPITPCAALIHPKVTPHRPCTGRIGAPSPVP